MKEKHILYWAVGISTVYSLMNLWRELPFPLVFAAVAVLSGVMLIITVYRDIYKDRKARVASPANKLFLFYFVCILSINVGFASIYFEMVRQDPNHFNGIIDGISAIYFSLVTFATVGFGDVHPLSATAKFAVISEILIAIMIIPVTIVTAIAQFINHKMVEQDKEIKEELMISKNKQLFRIK